MAILVGRCLVRGRDQDLDNVVVVVLDSHVHGGLSCFVARIQLGAKADQVLDHWQMPILSSNVQHSVAVLWIDDIRVLWSRDLLERSSFPQRAAE